MHNSRTFFQLNFKNNFLSNLTFFMSKRLLSLFIFTEQIIDWETYSNHTETSTGKPLQLNSYVFGTNTKWTIQKGKAPKKRWIFLFVQLNKQLMVNMNISSICYPSSRVNWSKFKLWVSQLAKHNSHVHTLYHRWNSYIIGALSGKPSFPRLLNFFYAPLKLLMAFNVCHTWKLEEIESNTEL